MVTTTAPSSPPPRDSAAITALQDQAVGALRALRGILEQDAATGTTDTAQMLRTSEFLETLGDLEVDLDRLIEPDDSVLLDPDTDACGGEAGSDLVDGEGRVLISTLERRELYVQDHASLSVPEQIQFVVDRVRERSDLSRMPQLEGVGCSSFEFYAFPNTPDPNDSYNSFDVPATSLYLEVEDYGEE